MELKTNVLYYGDNLDILRNHIPDESIDLIYLDPPFNSQADYNVLFKEPTGELSEAQLRAFSDTWHWDLAAEETFREIVRVAPDPVVRMVDSLRAFIGSNDMMAYLTMMTVRLLELRRVLKATGSLYLHCDPKASHYLKIVMDTVFGKASFRNEVIWKRTSAHSFAKRYGPVHDVLLFYTKTAAFTWHPSHQAYDPQYVETFFDHVDPDGRRWKRMDLTGRGVRHGPSGEVWRGIDVTAKGRHWIHPPSDLDELDRHGRIHWPSRANGMPRLKQYLDEMAGVALQDIWTDVRPLHNLAGERLGFDTQKPLALLERIIQASSNEGNVVLDPFCGCGTAVVAAHKLNRRWIGIDITHLAITVMKNRLRDSFPEIEFQVVGEPVDVASARALAEQDRYQFQWWALSLVNAKPVGDDRKKGADKGIDGVIGFVEARGKAKRVIVQVKSGHVNAAHIRDLKGTMEREKAELGLFITLEEPTQPMKTEAVSAGFYHSELWDKDYPRVQILTVEELLGGKQPELPSWASGGFPKAQKISRQQGKQGEMPL